MISSPSRSTPEPFRVRRARLRRIASHFDCPLHTRAYIVGKLAVDPAYHAILDHIRDSVLPVVDIGCGFGLLAHWLRENSCSAPLIGYDSDGEKIRLARAAATRAGYSGVSFEAAHALDASSRVANYVLLDLLHYLPPGERDDLLASLAARIREGGSVFIRSGIRDGSWRHRLTGIQERLIEWSGWISDAAQFEFPSIAEVVEPFEAAGCRCDARPLWGRMPFNNYLVSARYSE